MTEIIKKTIDMIIPINKGLSKEKFPKKVKLDLFCMVTYQLNTTILLSKYYWCDYTVILVVNDITPMPMGRTKFKRNHKLFCINMSIPASWNTSM